MSGKEILDNVLGYIKAHPTKPLKLYCVERNLKEGISKSKKLLEKYDFSICSIDLSSEMADYFRNILRNQLDIILTQNDLEMKPYSLIDDDTDNKVYTYALGKARAFSTIFAQLAQPHIRKVTSLEEIRDNIWAFCIGMDIEGEKLYSFRKTTKAKVATDEEQGLLKKVVAAFDTRDPILKPVEGELVSFDDKIDCISFKKEFYIFKKSTFETLTGLEEEFQENAQDVIGKIEATNLITGLDLVRAQAGRSRTFLKVLASIARKGNHLGLSKDEIKNMSSTLNQFEGRKLKVSHDGKVLLQTEEDIKDFVKLLNDYYKQGVVTGKFYKSNAGTVVEPRQ